MITNGKLAAIRECVCEEDLNYFFKVFGKETHNIIYY